MLITDAALYLPISERILGLVLDDAASPDTTIAGLPVPQIASLILLQYLPKLKERPSVTPGRILAEAIEVANTEVKKAGLPAFAASAVRMLDRTRIRAGYQLLADFRIVLLEDEAIMSRSYLTIDGAWDSTFRERHKTRLLESLQRIDLPGGGHRMLTAEQTQIFREVGTQADDHMHVQGYAGTGKSSLIKYLLAMLQSKGARVLVLAERERQLAALRAGIDPTTHARLMTFDKLIDEMIPQDFIVPLNRRLRQTSYSPAPMSDDDVVRHLGINPSGKFEPRQIARMVQSTLAGFCYSGDKEIDANHIPGWCAYSLDKTASQIVLHYTAELWRVILSPPSQGQQPLLRGYHRVKWAALSGWQIPANYTHVLIDECHDLAKPMLQILDCSPQAVISLGDEYQNLQGRPQQRSNGVRQREVTHSVRSGHLIESVVNPIIAAHPSKTKAPFHGNRMQKTELTYYDRPRVPEQPTVILVSDAWGLFEWAQRIAAENLDLELLSNPGALNMFVNDCIDLYRHGTRPRHRDLFRFESWDAVANRYQNNQGFQRIDGMLRHGYSNQDWVKTSARFTGHRVHGYALGLIEDVRNREFETVMLAPEMIDPVAGTGHAALAATGSSIYVAATRAQRQLIIPERLRNWIDEISVRK